METFRTKLSNFLSPLNTGIIKDINIGIDANILYFFYFAIILLRLPPINLFLIDLNILNSHSIARYILLFITACLLFKKNKIRADDVLLLLFFISQSFSIIGATDTSSFILSYKNLFFGLLVYFSTIALINTKKKVREIIIILIVTVTIYIIYEYVIYFHTNFFYGLRPLFYSSYWENLDVNYLRDRYFVDIFDFSLVPLILYIISFNIWFLPLLAFLLYFAAVSGFRSHLLAYGIGLFFYFAWFKDGLTKKHFLLISIFFIATVAYFVSNQPYLTQLTTITRIIDNPEESQLTVNSRLQMWGKALEIGTGHLSTGVGLGNYYLYSYKPNNIITASNWSKRFDKITDFSPHNLFFSTFAETGIIGLIGLFGLITYWFLADLKLYFQNAVDRLYIVIIFCFWSLFSYAMLNPAMPAAQYTILFWLFRGLIQNFYNGKIRKNIVVSRPA